MLEVGTGFHGEMTGRENVYLNGAILGMTKAEIDAKMDQIIEFSEVGDFIDTPVKRYSSGMYVKLAFSVAAHLDSEIMIMDEVLAVGDMKFQKKCLGRMGDAAGTEGRTVLYVSHNMNTIRQLCTRCVVLDQGKVIFDGDVEEAIAVYMQNESRELSRDIDLSGMKRLYKTKGFQMVRFSFDCGSEPIMKPGEKISYRMQINSETDCDDICFRCMVYFADGTPIAMATSRPGKMRLHSGENVISGVIDTSHLAPGFYSLRIALYSTNEFGGEELYDAVDRAVPFVIEDTGRASNMAWNHSKWGHVSMGDIKIQA
jgi:lipopolysaccharide transport system ATP-binding protein